MSSAKLVRICVLLLILVAVFSAGVWLGWSMINGHNAARKRSQQKLQGLGKGMAMYAATHGLLRERRGPPDSARTPWFYAPNDPAIRWTKTAEGAPQLEIVREHSEPMRIIACSSKHRDFTRSMSSVLIVRDIRDIRESLTRYILFSNGDGRWVLDEQFQEELAKPENAEFAKAFHASGFQKRFRAFGPQVLGGPRYKILK